MKKSLKILFLFVLVLFVLIGGMVWLSETSYNYHFKDPWQEALRKYFNEPPHETNNSKEPPILQLGERQFKIPRDYIQGNAESYISAGGINLVYMMPDFTPTSQFETREEYERARSDHRQAFALIQATETETPIPIIVDQAKKFNRMSRYDGKEHGLEHYLDNPDKKIQSPDIYIELNQVGGIVSIIECAQEGYVPSPVCSHVFDHNAIRYRISYNKQKYLSDWREIQRKAIEKIESFGINNKGNADD